MKLSTFCYTEVALHNHSNDNMLTLRMSSTWPVKLYIHSHWVLISGFRIEFRFQSFLCWHHSPFLNLPGCAFIPEIQRWYFSPEKAFVPSHYRTYHHPSRDAHGRLVWFDWPQASTLQYSCCSVLCGPRYKVCIRVQVVPMLNPHGLGYSIDITDDSIRFS